MPRTGRPRLPRVLVDCSACGKPLERTRAEVAKHDRHFCDGDCRATTSMRPRTAEPRICTICKAEFYRRPSDPQTECSKGCMHASRRAATYFTTHCAKCGKEYETRLKDPRKFCGGECAGVAPVARVNIPCGLEGCDESIEVRETEMDQIRYCVPEHRYMAFTARAKGSINSEGYRVRSVGGKTEKEHRLVMEMRLGRPLVDGENVHHRVSGRKTDNRPSNLELWRTSQPSGSRVEDLVNDAFEILATYCSQTHLAQIAELSAVAEIREEGFAIAPMVDGDWEQELTRYIQQLNQKEGPA